MSPARTAAALFLICLSGSTQDTGLKQPLCRAALNGDVTQVRTLLAHHADPNVHDEDAETPLIRAASLTARTAHRPENFPPADFEGLIALLLDHGADVNARDRQGRTALLAAMEGSASEYRVIGAGLSIAKLLLARGASVNVQDNNGWSPLLEALHLWADQPELIQLLLERGANVNARLKDRFLSPLSRSMRQLLRSVWSINTEAFPEAHFSNIPAQLSASCDPSRCRTLRFRSRSLPRIRHRGPSGR